MYKYFLFGLIGNILLNAAMTVPVTNKTNHMVKVLLLYLPEGEIGKVAGNALAELFVGKKEDKIEVLEDRFGKQFYGFEGSFGKENKKYYKSLILKPNESKSVSFKNHDCVRKIKAWIVEEKTITADQVKTTMLDQDDSTLGALYDKAQDDKTWPKMVQTKQPLSYVVYKPTLGDNSWKAITNNRDKNECDPKIEIIQSGNKLDVKAIKK